LNQLVNLFLEPLTMINEITYDSYMILTLRIFVYHLEKGVG
jgi:hypothetical protein